ncbi:MAG: DUF3413 domain-containing protein [Gammaproteobacteria bacterium]
MNTIMTRQQLFKWLFWFSFGNCLLLWLIGLSYLQHVTFLSSKMIFPYGKFLISTYLTFTYLGHLAVFALSPLLLMLPIAYFYTEKRLIIPLAITCNTLITLFILIDTFVFNQFRFHLNGIVFTMLLSSEASEIFDFSWFEYFILFFLIAIIVFIESFYGFWLSHKKKYPKIFTPVIFLFGCLYLSYMMLFFSNGALMFRHFLDNGRFIPFYEFTLAHLLSKNLNTFDLERYNEVNTYQPNQKNIVMHYPLKPLVCNTPKKQLNLVIIAIDSWRFDSITPSIMPNLFNFSKNSEHYLQHFSGGNGTRAGIFSLFYGLPATYWDSALNTHKDPVLIDTLLNEQYKTKILASAELTLPEFNKTVFLKIHSLATKSPGKNPLVRDQYITKSAISFIKSNKNKNKPFFTFLFYDSAHSFCGIPNLEKPFPISPKPCDRFTLSHTNNPTPYINRYKNALYFIDKQIYEIIKTLKKTNHFNDTVIVITGDHGQEFNDNHSGYWGHASNFTNFQIQTPLLIYWPGKKPKIINYQTTHYDIVPTLLNHLLGCQTPSFNYSVGQELETVNNPDFFIVGSYVGFGVITTSEIISISSMGELMMMDKHTNSVLHTHPPIHILEQAFEEINRFYK